MSSRTKLETFLFTTAALESPMGEDGEGIFRRRNFDNKDRKWMNIPN